MPLAQAVEHLQLFQPRQRAQAAAFRFLGLKDVLKIGIHGWRKRFSNFAHASSSEWRARMSPNPAGIQSSSPGLPRLRGYPGNPANNAHQP